MRTVYKYSLADTHQIPHSAKLVHVGPDPSHELCAWFEVDTDNTPSTVAFVIIGTGHPVPGDAKHVATVNDGPFMWHYYAVGLA